MTEEKVRTEEFEIRGDRLLATVKEILREGNVRRLIIKNDEGKTLVEIPLTFGVAGALLLPAQAALGAIAALVMKLRIVVEKVEKVEEAEESEEPEEPEDAENAEDADNAETAEKNSSGD